MTDTVEEMPADPFGITPVNITGEMLMKRVLWDIVPDHLITEVSRHLGLGESPEVEKWEEHAARNRKMPIAHTIPAITILTNFSVEAIRAAMLVSQGEEVLENHFYSHQSLGPMIYGSVVTVLAEMYDMRLIGFPTVVQEPTSD